MQGSGVRLMVVSIIALGLGAAAPPRAPRVNYMLHCQGCHRADGTGLSGRVPNLKGELGKFLTVPGGREFVVRVPGTANSTLTDADTAALLNWLVVEMGPATRFRPYSAAEVKRLRAQRLQDVARQRAALVNRIGQAARARQP